jgi:hypothetical protein
MSTLEQLCIKHGTNKVWHGYPSFYEKLFNDIRLNPLNFLEIGIDQGGSLFAWQEYFSNSTIYGIDIVIPDRIANQSTIRYAVTDQSSPHQLMQTLEIWNNPKFDIIIDDGSHWVSHQRISMETLWKTVVSGGYYIIEDLHTNIKALHSIHPHMNEHCRHIDETPTIHDKINRIMAGSTNEFGFPVSEISEVYYFNTPNKLSLSCAFKKV